jgi:hypothetical protein
MASVGFTTQRSYSASKVEKRCQERGFRLSKEQITCEDKAEATKRVIV